MRRREYTYKIIELANGRYECSFTTEDGVDKFHHDTLNQALSSMISAARDINKDTITNDDISVITLCVIDQDKIYPGDMVKIKTDLELKFEKHTQEEKSNHSLSQNRLPFAVTDIDLIDNNPVMTLVTNNGQKFNISENEMWIIKKCARPNIVPDWVKQCEKNDRYYYVKEKRFYIPGFDTKTDQVDTWEDQAEFPEQYLSDEVTRRWQFFDDIDYGRNRLQAKWNYESKQDQDTIKKLADVPIVVEKNRPYKKVQRVLTNVWHKVKSTIT